MSKLQPAMKRGIAMEPLAASVCASKAKNSMVNHYSCGLVINPKCPWLGCSPDKKVFHSQEADNGMCPFGLLEVKVVCKDRFTKRISTTNEFKLNEKHYY